MTQSSESGTVSSVPMTAVILNVVLSVCVCEDVFKKQQRTEYQAKSSVGSVSGVALTQ